MDASTAAQEAKRIALAKQKLRQRSQPKTMINTASAKTHRHILLYMYVCI